MTGFVPPIHPTPEPEQPLLVGNCVILNPSAIPVLRERTDTLMRSWGFEPVAPATYRIAEYASVLPK